jgi:hypothetical protein
MRTISRQDLFEDAWTRPLSKIAPEFGVTDVGLRKICSRNGIPTPVRGYWAQVAAGKVFARPQLRPPQGRERDVITIVPTRPPAQEVKAAGERAKAVVASRIEPPDNLARPASTSSSGAEPDSSGEIHKLVQRTHSNLTSKSGVDLVHVHGKGLFAVTASPARADRIAQILTSLIAAVEALGWRVESGEHCFRLVPNGEPIGFEIVEQTDRLRHAPTDSEQAALRKHEDARQRAARRGEWFSDWDRPKIPDWDYVPNGLLTLQLAAEPYIPDPVRRKFSDGRHQQLERMIDKVVESLAAFAASSKALRERRERERLEAIEAQKRREDHRRRQELENKRVEFLQAQMARLVKAREIEDFVREVEAQGSVDGVLAAFLDWARDWAAELRVALANETIRQKLEQFDLMNDQASIGSWVKVG